MTALAEEVEGAIAEGAELLTLKAPARIEGDSDGKRRCPCKASAIGPAGQQRQTQPGQLLSARGKDSSQPYYSGCRAEDRNCCLRKGRDTDKPRQLSYYG